MSEQIVVLPVGIVHNPLTDPVDDGWDSVQSRIDLDETRFTAECLVGLDEFSHVEVVFLLHRVPEDEVCAGTRHPRGRSDFPPVGIFAQRGRNRPNRIGVTVCRLLAVRETSIEVEGLDAIDGTPVLDIKPYIREFAPRGTVRQPRWSTELMARYWSPAKA
ncbi:MAG TPA: SAM-dependent methyltransferase [Bryobacteraceae bacterium]|nr:SAM-dependent methyltransferase [Bryobacteraceae bacterium]